MDGTPLEKLACDLGLLAEREALGIEFEGGNHFVTNQQELLI